MTSEKKGMGGIYTDGDEVIVDVIDGKPVFEKRVSLALTAGTIGKKAMTGGYARYWVNNADSWLAVTSTGTLPANFNNGSGGYTYAYMEASTLNCYSSLWSATMYVNVRYQKT